MWEEVNMIVGTFKNILNWSSLVLIALLFQVVNAVILAQWDAGCS